MTWYLYPDESHNEDGKHIAYLCDSEKWREFDPRLFDSLKSIVNSNQRSTQSIESSALLGDAQFSSQLLTFEGKPELRSALRAAWFKNVLSDMNDCDIVFADPDNGLCEDRNYQMSTREYWKRIPLYEAHVLSAGRTGIIYHHNTRRAGGHAKEIQHWLSLLGNDSIALYWRHLSNRTFFIIHPDREIKQLVREFASKWAPYFELHELTTKIITDNSDAPDRQLGQMDSGKSCPECGHVFKGNGWGGIDAHWRARHVHIMSYSMAWPLIKQGIRPSETLE